MKNPNHVTEEPTNRLENRHPINSDTSFSRMSNNSAALRLDIAIVDKQYSLHTNHHLNNNFSLAIGLNKYFNPSTTNTESRSFKV